jgi:hypothetical protein
MSFDFVHKGEQPEQRIYSVPRALRGDVPLSRFQTGAAK